MRRRSWWGWGWEDQALTPEQKQSLAGAVGARLGLGDIEVQSPPDLDAAVLPPPRFEPPAALARLCSTEPFDRASHTYGKSFRDVVRGFNGDLSPAPSFVAYPESEADVVALLDWCASAGAPAVPYGGGSSVVGGTELAGGVCIDMTRMDRVVEIDRASRAARIQGGALGPVLEEQLRPEGYTLRHYPQSFEFSTLGGWLATRSGGHYATNYTHIDDFCESMRVVTPAGLVESRRLPGSGAGPSPDRLFLGSEGTLGIITEAWMRVQERPVHKSSAGVRFETFNAGVAAARALSQAALFPANCRLLDPGEAMTAAGVADGSALLVLGFESADHPVDAWMARAVELVQDHGGTLPEGVRTSSGEGAAGAWKGSFLRAPYTRDALVAMDVIVETFETAITWDRFDALHASVTDTVDKALAEVCGGGWITCRFTHVYPDGPAPYFSVVAPGRRGSLVQMWDEVKQAASEALLAAGGTITHHHAVGRDHRPWYERQRPDLFADALRAAKSTLDPSGVLNPGVLFAS
ncbi:MAG: alkyldihydroxyacetonephosphate synthase [Acidimicrobiaceae bacterium]|jgi:alkyldihydroxyacetonephosphate synthase|nr:alkyldihydroxyacetonephosphate synthase [Acidimicrobiaceae bacterium]